MKRADYGRLLRSVLEREGIETDGPTLKEDLRQYLDEYGRVTAEAFLDGVAEFESTEQWVVENAALVALEELETAIRGMLAEYGVPASSETEAFILEAERAFRARAADVLTPSPSGGAS